MSDGDMDAEAYRLADRWSAEVVITECVSGSDGMGMTWTFASDSQVEVDALCEASEDVQEAVSWLIRRELAILIEDGDSQSLLFTGAEDCL